MAVRLYLKDAIDIKPTVTGTWRDVCIPYLSGSLTIEFDGGGSGNNDIWGEYYDEITITRRGENISYRGTSKTISFSSYDFDYGEIDSVPKIVVKVGRGGSPYAAPTKLVLGDVFLNGVKIDVVNTPIATFDDYYSFNIMLDPLTFKPQIEMDDITIKSDDWNGFPVANATILKVDGIRVSNARSDDPNKYFSISQSGHYNCDFTITKVNDTTSKINDIVTVASEEKAIVVTVEVSVRNRYFANGRSNATYVSKSITVYPYHLPRLFLNSTGEVSYVSRCQQNGTPDGLGNYGHLHLVWDVAKINTTGSGIINTLQNCVVILNGGTTLSPTGGSLESGYLDYIFPLAVETQGNLEITLTDTRKSNTITGLSVPKGSMPMSLYDGGGGTGVAFGRMATQEGLWCYMPIYIQSATNGSSKMFRLKIDDNGNISTEQV